VVGEIVVAMASFEIRDARRAELTDGCALLARALAFSERDALPPWLVQTSAAQGGLALGAFDASGLVGFSFALPGRPGELFSCGLAVDPPARGRGIARALKLAQRERALAAGVSVIRWTADPLAAPALALYLGRLGARLVAYEPELYAAVRDDAVPPDDVALEWPLTASAPIAQRPAERIEIPLDAPSLPRSDRLRWRMAVRRSMVRALDRGAVGTDVLVDRARARAWVLFCESA